MAKVVVAIQSVRELRVSSTCTSRELFVQFFRPLYRDRVLFIPTRDAPPVGERFQVILELADRTPLLHADAELVDPYAVGLATGGYSGVALRFAREDSRGANLMAALALPVAGTVPFGVPSAGDAASPLLCSLTTVERVGPSVDHGWDETETSDLTNVDELPFPSAVQAVVISMADGTLDPQPNLPDLPLDSPFPALDRPRRPASPQLVDGAAARGRSGRLAPPNTKTDLIVPPSSQTKAVITTACLAVFLGLGAGYVVWGRDRGRAPVEPSPSEVALARPDPRPIDPAASAEDPANEADQAPQQPSPKPAGVLPAPPATLVAPCNASITSNPEGAAIFHDGLLLGATPYEGSIECGPANLELHQPGYLPQQRVVEAKESQPVELSFSLARPIYEVLITTVPKKSLITLNGKKLGRSPLRLSLPGFVPGELLVTRPGFRPHRQELVLKADKSETKIKLRKRR